MKIVVIITALPFLLLQTKQPQPEQYEVRATGPRVLFFAPTQAEQDSLVRTDGLELAQLFDDFDYYAGKAGVFLNGSRIPAAYATDPVILVRFKSGAVRKFERKTIPEFVGVILIDSTKEPFIIPGVTTDEELIADFKEFFRLK